MRVHFLLSGLAVSGGVLCVLRHAAGLVALGDDVRVYVAGPVDPAVLAAFPPDARGAPVLPLAPGQPLPEADVQIATHYSTAPTVAQAPGRLRAHFVQHVEALFAVDAADPALARASIDFCFRVPLYRIANSTWARRTLRRLYGYTADLACNAVDAPAGDPAPRPVGQPPVVVSFVGAPRWKGAQDAYQALEVARAARPDWDLQWHVYGAGTVPTAPWVHPHGVIPHAAVWDLYRQADVVLCPSWAESYPLPPIEAMAAGAVVVTTPFGVEDYVEPGRNAWVAPPRDPWGLAQAVLRALEADPAERAALQRAAVATARRHAWPAAVRGFRAALERGLARPAPLPGAAEQALLAELGVPVVTG